MAKATAGTRRQQMGARQWQDAVLRFQNSGQSVREFCLREGLSVSGLYRWKAALAMAVSGNADQASPRPVPALPVGAGFLDLGPLISAPASAVNPVLLQLDLRIDLGGGLILHLQRH